MSTRITTTAVLVTLLLATGSAFARNAERAALRPSNSWVPHPYEQVLDGDANVRFEMRRDPSNNR
jgi:hypothetical protein